jgi:hypothetical protein
MHPYPPEYDDPCVLSIEAPELPDHFDPNIYWDEDGRVFVMSKDDGAQIDMLSDVEATDDEEADLARIKAEVLARFATDAATLNALTAELWEAFEASQAMTKATMPTFDEFWADVEDYVGIECDQAGDWTPVPSGDGDWGSMAECVEFQIEDGIRYIVVRDVDRSGNWDATYYNSEEFTACYLAHLSTDEHFLGWGEYHLWCAENGGIDPLGEFFTQPTTVQQHLDAVKDNIKYLWMGVRPQAPAESNG